MLKKTNIFQINITKSEICNKLQVNTLNVVLLSNELIKTGSCTKFEPPKDIIQLLNLHMHKTNTDDQIDTSIDEELNVINFYS